MKRADGSGNGIDAALNARDDPNYARTVYDAYNDREVSCVTVLQNKAFSKRGLFFCTPPLRLERDAWSIYGQMTVASNE